MVEPDTNFLRENVGDDELRAVYKELLGSSSSFEGSSFLGSTTF
jgi:hypothetical protein